MQNKAQGKRKLIYQKAHGRCAYCGRKLYFKKMTVDHIEPIAQGGSDDIDNLLPACDQCNQRKGALSLEEFREQIERLPVVLRRGNEAYQLAVRYKLVKPQPRPVRFYFEESEVKNVNSGSFIERSTESTGMRRWRK